MMFRWRWSSALLGLGLSFGTVIACSSSTDDTPSPEASFCDALAEAYAGCAGAAGACGDTMRVDCTKLAALLNPSVLSAATTCLKGASCDANPLGCLGASLADVAPTPSQAKLAESFCEGCSPVGGDACEAAFFGAGDVPGAGVALLPFGDAPLSAIEASCTSNRLGKTACQAAFSTCLATTVTKVLVESVSAEAVKCVLGGINDGLGSAASGGGRDGGGSGAACEGCAGCCEDGICKDGVEAGACGSGGGACESCNGGATCREGKCVAACGPDTCAGCCDADGQCRAGSSSGACGSGGEACTSCGGDRTCSEGACIDASCQATCASGCCTSAGCQPGDAPSACGKGGNACVACGAGRTCSGGACQIGVASKWDVVLVAARLPDKSGGWDVFGGLPDPFAQASTGSIVGAMTEVKANTLTPTWNAIVLEDVSASALKSQLKVEVWDDDPVFDDHVGICLVNVTDASFDGKLKTASCPPAASGDVAFEIDYRLKPR